MSSRPLWKLRTLRLSARLIALPLAAAAQPAPAADPAVPGSAPVAEAAPAVPADEPRVPEVSDPMLDPIPPPRFMLASWQQAISTARGRSSSLRIAAANVEAASAQARQALAGALPSLVGTANVNHHLLRGTGLRFGSGGLTQGDIPDPATTWNTGLSLRQPLFAPATWQAHGTAKQAAEASRLSAKDAERLVLAAVADTIVTVVTAERVAEMSRIALRSALSTLSLTRTRARLGAASAVDVLRAEQEVSLSRAQIVSADEAVRRSREALGLALGYSEGWGVKPGIEVASMAADARASCRAEDSVASRADVRAAAANVALAERGVDNVDWQFAPTVDLVSSLTYLSEDRTSPNGEHVTWTVGAQLVWPLYDGGLRYGRKEAEHSRVRVAREQLTDTQRRAELEVTQADRTILVAKANLEVGARAREIARESARLARVAFVNGSGTSFDLVDAARRLREADVDLTIKEFEVIRAHLTALLARATCDV